MSEQNKAPAIEAEPCSWVPIKEKALERAVFDAAVSEIYGDVRIAMATTLRVFADQNGGAFADLCRVMANEIAKLYTRSVSCSRCAELEATIAQQAEQLQALAAQTKAMREALSVASQWYAVHGSLHHVPTEKQIAEALSLPDLATPILRKVREELSNEVAISMFEHFVTMINSPDLSIKRNGRCIKKEIIEDLRRAHLAAHLADDIEKGE